MRVYGFLVLISCICALGKSPDTIWVELIDTSDPSEHSRQSEKFRQN